MTWIDIGALEDIPVRNTRMVRTDQVCIAMLRAGTDKLFALDHACPPKRRPLCEGIVGNNSVTRPPYNCLISFESRKVHGANEGRVATYPVRVDNGPLMLDTTSLMERSAA
ncbi:MAG: nitrite reductase (NAD(P)H) small subunit [Pseudomonadota bacterium]